MYDYIQVPNIRCACSGLQGICLQNMIPIHLRTHVQAPIIIRGCMCVYRYPILDVHAAVLEECVRDRAQLVAHRMARVSTP